jgi:hypothetical protein
MLFFSQAMRLSPYVERAGVQIHEGGMDGRGQAGSMERL